MTDLLKPERSPASIAQVQRVLSSRGARIFDMTTSSTMTAIRPQAGADSLTFDAAQAITHSLGMDVSDDGIGFTVCGGQLTTGEDAPAWVQDMNGWDCYEIARAVLLTRPWLVPASGIEIEA